MVALPGMRRIAAGACTAAVATAIAWPVSAAGAAPSSELKLSASPVSLLGRTAAVKAPAGGDTAAEAAATALRQSRAPQTPDGVAADEVSFTVDCSPESVVVGGAEASCTIRAVNSTFDDQVVDIDSRANRKLKGTGVDGATAVDARNSYLHDAALAGRTEGVPTVDPGPVPAGYLPLDAFGIAPVPIGDEEFLALTVPPYVFNGRTYTVISINSNGYLVAGTATSEDNNCCSLPTGPSPERPNSLLAPFWTDLDGTGAPGVFAASLTDGVSDWLVIEHRVNVFGTLDQRVFEVWIGLNGVQDISYVYDPSNLPVPPPSQDTLIGAENGDGLGDLASFAPTEDLVVASSDAGPAGEVSYTTTVKGQQVGLGIVRSRLTIDGQPDWMQARETVEVTAP